MKRRNFQTFLLLNWYFNLYPFFLFTTVFSRSLPFTSHSSCHMSQNELWLHISEIYHTYRTTLLYLLAVLDFPTLGIGFIVEVSHWSEHWPIFKESFNNPTKSFFITWNPDFIYHFNILLTSSSVPSLFGSSITIFSNALAQLIQKFP